MVQEITLPILNIKYEVMVTNLRNDVDLFISLASGVTSGELHA